jgi:hypothetical protein
MMFFVMKKPEPPYPVNEAPACPRKPKGKSFLVLSFKKEHLP